MKLADLFVVRPTGAPFEILDEFSTTNVSAAARDLLALRATLSTAVQAAAEAIDREDALSFGQRQRLRRKLFKRGAIAGAPALPAVAHYQTLLPVVTAADAAFEALLARTYEVSRARIYELAATHCPEIAVLQLTSEALARMLASRTHKDDRSLAIWLQRLCSKNDTISRFGPSMWGRVDALEPGLRIDVEPGIAESVVWIERWVVLGVIAAIGEDPAVPEKPAPMFLDDTPLATLTADVSRWTDGEPRARWLAVIARITALGEDYRRDRAPAHRQAVLDRLFAILEELRIPQRRRTGRLYEAANPLVENCRRGGEVVIGKRWADELVDDAMPWLTLFRDVASVAASRVYDGLHDLYVKAPRPNGRLSLADFLAFSETAGMSLRGPTIARLAQAAFRDIRAAFGQRLAQRADAAEWELTPEECGFLAGPGVPRADLQLPSADLTIAADSADAVARGDFQWIVSELHHGFVLMGQSLLWSCPDRARVQANLRAANVHQPAMYYDAATSIDQPVHSGSESIIDALDGNIATTMRTKPHWKTFAPGDVDVVLDEARRDLRVRHGATDLGSLFPLPRFFFGMHPFFPLQLPHHTPRLRRGRTIFQRRAWVITAEELGGPHGELSRELVLAVERVRAARDLPRWVFLRIRDDVLSGADAMNRLKDIKPICIDLESYVFLGVLARRLERYGSVELVEMLPAPHQLVWREADGHRCFELRTQLVPT